MMVLALDFDALEGGSPNETTVQKDGRRHSTRRDHCEFDGTSLVITLSVPERNSVETTARNWGR